jgi:hypothetical protein
MAIQDLQTAVAKKDKDSNVEFVGIRLNLRNPKHKRISDAVKELQETTGRTKTSVWIELVDEVISTITESEEPTE